MPRSTDPLADQQQQQMQRDYQRQQSAALSQATQEQREAERRVAQQERQQQRAEKDAATQDFKASETAKEAAFRAQGIQPWTGADGVLYADPHHEQKQQAAADKEAAKAAKAASELAADTQRAEAIRSGRKHQVNPVDGTPIYLESPEAVAARQTQAAEDLRRKSIDDQLKSHEAEYGVRKAEQEAQGFKPLSETARRNLSEKGLKKAKEEAFFAVQSKLQAQAGAKSGTDDWVPFNEEATPGATTAASRLAALKSADDLTDDDLALLEGDDATRPTLEKVRRIQGRLSKDDELQKFHGEHATRAAELKLRRDAPEKWAQMQATRRATLSPEQLAQELETSGADITTRTEALQQSATELASQRATHTQELERLSGLAAQRRSQGIPAGELVSYTAADGSLEHWPRDLAAQREAVQAKAQDTEAQQAPLLASLQVQQGELQRDVDLHNATLTSAKDRATVAQQTARASTLGRLRHTPGMESVADGLASLQADRDTRYADMQATYEGTPPPEAVQALDADIQRQTAQQLAQGQQRFSAATAAWQAIKAQGGESDTVITNAAQALGMPVAEMQRLVQDAESLDWETWLPRQGEPAGPPSALGGVINTDLKGNAFSETIKGIFREKDTRQTRLLSSGALVVNPLLTGPEEYSAAVSASKATPEAKAIAMEELPAMRQRYGQETLETLSTFLPTPAEHFSRTVLNAGVNLMSGMDSAVAQKWAAFLAKAPKDQPVTETAAQFADGLKNDSSPLGVVLRKSRMVGSSVRQGIDDVGAQALAVLGGATGSQTLMAGAEALNADSATLQRQKDVTGAVGGNVLERAPGEQLPRIAPSVVPAGAGARIAQGGLRLFAGTAAGRSLFPALAAGIQNAATPAQAIQAVQTLTRAGVAGSSAAGAAQTYGAQLADVYSTLRSADPTLDHATALKQAQTPAILSGLVTAGLTVLGGSSGVERLLSRPAEARQLVERQFTTLMQRAGFVSGKVLTGAVKEIFEESADELFSQVQAAVGSGQSVQNAVAQFMASLPELALATAALGGAGEAPSAIQESGRAPAPQAPANLPENIAAAWAAIENHSLPDLDPVTQDAVQRRASLALSLAQGGALQDVEEPDLNAAGWTRNGSKVEPLKDYTGPAVLDIDSDGRPIIKDSYVQALRDNGLAPVAAAIPASETQTRNRYAQPPAAAPDTSVNPKIDTSARRELNSSAADGVRDSTAPDGAGVGSSPASGITSKPSEELSRPATEPAILSRHMQERGLPASTADTVGAQILARPEFTGKTAEQVYRDPVAFRAALDALGVTGSLNSKESTTQPLRQGAAAAPPATAPAQAKEGSADIPSRASQPVRSGSVATSAPQTSPAASSSQTPTQLRGLLKEKEISDLDASRQIQRQFSASTTTEETLAAALVEHLHWKPFRAQIASMQIFGDGSPIAINAASRSSSSSKDENISNNPTEASQPVRSASASAPSTLNPQLSTTQSPLRSNAAYARAKLAALSRIQDPARKTWARQFFALFEASFATRHELYDAIAIGPIAAKRLQGAMTAVEMVQGQVTRLIDLDRLVASFNYLETPAAALTATGLEEDIHAVVLHLARAQPEKYGPAALKKQWKALPRPLQEIVWRSYLATTLGVRPSASAPSPPAAAPTLPAVLSSAEQYHLHNEFLRMLVQDKHFAGQITETVDPQSSGLLDWAKNLLKDLSKLLRDLLGKVPTDLRTHLEAMTDEIAAQLKVYEAKSSTTTARLASLTSLRDPAAAALQSLRTGALFDTLATTGSPIFRPAALSALFDTLSPALQSLAFRSWQATQSGTGQKKKTGVLPQITDAFWQGLTTAPAAPPPSRASKPDLLHHLLTEMAINPAFSQHIQLLHIRGDSERSADTLVRPGSNSLRSLTLLTTTLRDRLSPRANVPLLDALAATPAAGLKNLAHLHAHVTRALADLIGTQFALNLPPTAKTLLEQPPPSTTVNAPPEPTATVNPAQQQAAAALQARLATEADQRLITRAANLLRVEMSAAAQLATQPLQPPPLEGRAADMLAALVDRENETMLNASPQARLGLRQRLLAQVRAAAWLRGESSAEIQRALDAGTITPEYYTLVQDLLRAARGDFTRRTPPEWRLTGEIVENSLRRLGIAVDREQGRGHTLGRDTPAYIERNHPILRQSTLDELADVLPITRQLIPWSEQEARQHFGLPSSPASGDPTPPRSEDSTTQEEDAAPDKQPKSSTQLTLAPADAAPFVAFARSIPEADLYTSLDPEWSDGAVETEPHITVLYGLTQHQAEPVAEVIRSHGPVTVHLGKLSLFENDDFDVLKVSVEGQSIRDLNAKLRSLPHSSSFPDYTPHLTLAYLKKGSGKKYAGDPRFEGQNLTFNTLTFSPPQEVRATLGKPEIPLLPPARQSTADLPIQPSAAPSGPLSPGRGSPSDSAPLNTSPTPTAIPLSKRGQVRRATFPDAASLAAFQFKLDADTIASARSKPADVTKAEQRGLALLARLMEEETTLGRAALEQRLLAYHAAVVQQAEASSAFTTYTPPSFHAFSEGEGGTGPLARSGSAATLPAPVGGDIISAMQQQGIRRLGPPDISDGWTWYRELQSDAAASKLKNAEAQRLARAGDITDAKARLAWVEAHLVSRTSGRSIDEAAAELAESDAQQFPIQSGDELGRALLDALAARLRARETPSVESQEATAAAAESAGTDDFSTYAAGVTGSPFTAERLAELLTPDDEIQVGQEWLTVQDVDRSSRTLTLESSRFGSVTLRPDQILNLRDGPNHLRLPPLGAPRSEAAPASNPSSPSVLNSGSAPSTLTASDVSLRNALPPGQRDMLRPSPVETTLRPLPAAQTVTPAETASLQDDYLASVAAGSILEAQTAPLDTEADLEDQADAYLDGEELGPLAAAPRLAESALQDYLALDDVRIPPAKQASALSQVRAVADLASKSPRKPLPFPRPTPDEFKRSSLPALREQSLRRFRALMDRDPTAIATAFASSNTISRLLHSFVTREIPGFDIRGAIIQSAEDFAAFNQAVRSPFFESVKIAVLGLGQQVIHSQIVHVGSLNESIFSPNSVLGIIDAAQIQNPRQKITGFLVAHNHPSGNPDPSDADNRSTRRIRDIAESIGIPFIDHVITNGEGFFSYRDKGLLPESTGYNSRSKPRIPTLPRPAPPTPGTMADYEILPASETIPLSQPWITYPYLEALKTADPTHLHVIFLDSRLTVRAVERFPSTIEHQELKRSIALSAAREGAQTFLVSFPSQSSPSPYSGQVQESGGDDPSVVPLDSERRFARTLNEFGQTLGLPMGDAISSAPVSPGSAFRTFSFREMGILYAAPRTTSPSEGSAPTANAPLSTSEKVASAAALTDTTPSQAQKAAGNYAKGKVRVQGLHLSIENPRGSTRSGTDGRGRPWSVTMPHHYGYFLGTEGQAADGDHVDFFLGPDPDSPLVVIINQRKPPTTGDPRPTRSQSGSNPPLSPLPPVPNSEATAGIFDEHKVMLGFTTPAEAVRGYLAAYTPGWKGLQSAIPTTLPVLKQWLESADGRNKHTTTPVTRASLARVAAQVALPSSAHDTPPLAAAARSTPSPLGPVLSTAVTTAKKGLTAIASGDQRLATLPAAPTVARLTNQAADSSGAAFTKTLRFPGQVVGVTTRGVSHFLRTTGLEQGLASLGSNQLDQRFGAPSLAAAATLVNNALVRVGGPDIKSGKQAAVAWLQGTEGFAPTARAIVDQFVPTALMSREWLALSHEMQRKTAFGAETSNDLIRALSGNPRLSDLAYPPEFAQNPVYRQQLFDAMEGRVPWATLPPEMQRLGQRLRQLLRETGQELVRQGIMHPDTFEELQADGWMPRYSLDEAQESAGSVLAAFKLGVKDLLQQRSTAYHIVDTATQDRSGQPATVNRSEGQGGSGARRNRWRFRDAASRDAFYHQFVRTQTLAFLQGVGVSSPPATPTRSGSAATLSHLLAALDSQQRREIKDEIKTLTPADLENPARLSPALAGIVKQAKRIHYDRFDTRDPFEPPQLIKDPVYAIARYVLTQTHNAATMELLRATAVNPEWTSDVSLQGHTAIPDSDRFGPLAGKFVQSDIAQQILDKVDVPNAALAFYDAILRKWKSGKLVWNPASHIRDAIGNTMFAYLGGNSLWNPGNWQYYQQAVNVLREGGDTYRELIEHGILGGDAYSGMVRERLKGILPEAKTVENYNPGLIQRFLFGFGEKFHATHEQLAEWRRFPDDFYKVAAYLKAKETVRASDPASSIQDQASKAAAHVRKWFPYYDRLGGSATTRAAGRFINPFFSFFRESTRILATAAVERPLALTAALAFPAAVSALSALLLGLDDRDRDEIMKDLGGRGKGVLGLGDTHLFSMLLPVRSAQGAVQQWDISAVMPFADLLGQKIVPLAEKENAWQTLWRQTASAGPLFGLLVSWVTNRDTYSGKHLVENDMTTREMIGALTQHAAGVALPPLAPDAAALVGLGDGGPLSRAGERQTNKTLQTYDPLQTVLRTLIGFNIKNAEANPYRQADDFRRSLGLEVTTGFDYGTTAESRIKRLLVHELAQETPNLTRIANLLPRLKALGIPLESEKDITNLVKIIDPAALIGGSKALDLTAADARVKFRSQLPPASRALHEATLAEYARLKQRTPALLRQATAPK